jgi:hypothetical protein
MSISNTSGDVLLTQLFLIFNESGYAFDNFRLIPYGVKFARLWIPIREQIFPNFILMLYEYTIILNPIRRCAQKLELHDHDTIIFHIDTKMLYFGMSHQTIHSFQHVWLDEGLEIWHFLNHVRDHRHMVQIHK